MDDRDGRGSRHYGGDSDSLLHAVIEGTSDAVYVKDRQGRYLLFNSAAGAIVGLTAEQVLGKDDRDVLTPDVAHEVMARDREVMAKGVAMTFEETVPVAAGIRTFSSTKSPFRDADGAIVGLVGVSRDITDAKHAEAALKRQIADKEVLLREVHHRVKNNLQFVSSLLALQAARFKDPQLTSAIKESQQRVRAMAIMHEQLYRGPNLASVPIARHLTALCADLYRSYSVDPDRIALDLRVADVSMDLDRSIRCGLIVNELVSNAILHAFPDSRQGRITVRLDTTGDDYELAVGDNGVGLPDDVDPLRTESLGLQLVADLADQLGAGAPSVARDGQTLFVVRFPAGDGGARS